MSKFPIQCKWVTEDSQEHNTQPAAKDHQFLLEAAKDAGYMPGTAPSKQLLVDLKKMTAAGWMLTAPAIPKEGQFPV